jgi:hypothetical protein
METAADASPRTCPDCESLMAELVKAQMVAAAQANVQETRQRRPYRSPCDGSYGLGTISVSSAYRDFAVPANVSQRRWPQKQNQNKSPQRQTKKTCPQRRVITRHLREPQHQKQKKKQQQEAQQQIVSSATEHTTSPMTEFFDFNNYDNDTTSRTSLLGSTTIGEIPFNVKIEEDPERKQLEQGKQEQQKQQQVSSMMMMTMVNGSPPLQVIDPRLLSHFSG